MNRDFVAARKMSREDNFVYKVAIVGDAGVGKSAITLRFLYDEYDEEYIPTKADSHRKEVFFNGRSVMLDILDTAGQEDYAGIRDGYYRNVDGFICVFSVTERETFQAMDDFRDQILRIKDDSANKVPFLLVGNKVDLEQQRCVRLDNAEYMSKRWNCPYYESSAKTMINIDQLFYDIMGQIKNEHVKPLEDPSERKGTKFDCHRKPKCAIS